MPEPQPDLTRRAKRTPGLGRRASDRHFAAVIAQEIRRLGSGWRPAGRRADSRRRGENPRPKEAF
jgi:hypothetical protein